jgi:hypothetical protein
MDAQGARISMAGARGGRRRRCRTGAPRLDRAASDHPTDTRQPTGHPMTGAHALALKAAAILWVVWGLVHALAGILTLVQEPSAGFAAIADAVDPLALATAYHPAVEGVLNQHAWNLLWFGVVTIAGAVFVWRGNPTAIWVTGMVGGLADLGYLVFLDLPGFVRFFPGTVMTLISASAIALSFWVWLSVRLTAAARA